MRESLTVCTYTQFLHQFHITQFLLHTKPCHGQQTQNSVSYILRSHYHCGHNSHTCTYTYIHVHVHIIYTRTYTHRRVQKQNTKGLGCDMCCVCVHTCILHNVTYIYMYHILMHTHNDAQIYVKTPIHKYTNKYTHVHMQAHSEMDYKKNSETSKTITLNCRAVTL